MLPCPRTIWSPEVKLKGKYKNQVKNILRTWIALTSHSGMLFEVADRLLSKEVGPVRLESVQARLAQCIYLLASSRINQAWYNFGTTSQMILALGLHRKRYSQSSNATSGAFEIDARKRVFWSAYTLDRYLSVILGRPRIFCDEDIDQHFPDELNDIALTDSEANSKVIYNHCLLEAPIFHAKSVLFS